MRNLSPQSTALACSVVILFSCGTATTTPPLPPPELPPAQSAIAIPAGNTAVLKSIGEGSQIYACLETAPGAFGWKLDRPEAVLTDINGKNIGKHYKGPTWESNDGSKVVGSLDLGVNAPDPKSSIQWLRVKAVSHEKDGVFARVSYIQRVDTVAGLPPSDTCDATRVGGATVSIPYKATYYFYVPAS